MTKLPDQRDQLPFVLNIVRKGSSPEDSPEERIDQEKTLETRQRIVDHLGRLPRVAQSVHEQMGTANDVTIHKPDADVIAAVSHSRQDVNNFCGGCAFFDYISGQSLLGEHGGAWAIIEKMGGPEQAKWLGDWEKYGWCEATEQPCDLHATACERFEKKKRGRFGRILSGVWKRLEDI